MISPDWLSKNLKIFKNSPNSTNIFEEIGHELDILLKENNFDKIIGTSKGSVSSYCGISFKKDQLLYHCSDCALDDTCVLCDKCFNFDAHKDHNYWYTIGSNNSGSCDCGEEDSWKNDLKCPFHTNTSVEPTMKSGTEDLNSLKTILDPLLLIVVNLFCKYGASRNVTRTDDSVLILYNDENHSFMDVIDILTTEIEISTEDAEKYATLVDTKGFAPILFSSAATCSRISRKFKTLTTSVESVELTFEMILATEIVYLLSIESSTSSLLKKYFVEWFLEDYKEDFNTNNLGVIFTLDHMLWKGVRLNFNEILNSCNAIDQESKKRIALTYCKNYKMIFGAFLREKREPHLSVTNFSVQIFTLIPVAEYCLEKSNILAELFGKMIEILEPGFIPSAGLDFSKLRGFNFQKFLVLAHDTLHLIRNVRSQCLNIPEMIKTVDNFMYLLNLLTHMQGHFIKTGNHVTYDRDNYDNANYICFEIQQIAQEYAKIIVNNCEMSAIWSLFDKHIEQKPSLCKLLGNNSEDKQICPLFKSRKRCSFFGSLAWFYASIVKEALKKGCELNIPSKIVKTFAIDSLNRIIFAAEVRSGLWVRNGLIVRQQEYFYSSTVYHNLTYFQDVYNCIIGSRLIDKISFIEMIIKHSCVIEYLQNQDQTGPVVDQFMIIFINCCSICPIDLDSDQILINSLCTEGMTKSSLVKILPDFMGEGVELRSKLQNMTKLTSVNAIGVDAKLEITKQYMDLFDPFYWAFAMNFRLKAWSSFKEKRRLHSDLLYDLFMKKYQISAEISKEADFLIEMLSNFADSASTDHAFSLEMVLILLKAITNITSDQDCLERVSKCIEKFKLKKNIPDHVLKFLASICPFGSDVEIVSSNFEKEVQDRKEKRSNILASFKRQRDAFIAEPESATVIDEDDQICVVCSESGCGGNDKSFLAIPFQMTESSYMIHGDKMGHFLRGCHHLIHNNCYDSLPSHGSIKKCTLCSSIIDGILPFYSEPQYLGPKEIILSNNSSSENILEKISRFQGFDTKYDNIILGLSCTLVYICEKYDSIDNIPLHQILTLTNISRSLLKFLSNNSCNYIYLNLVRKLFNDELEDMTVIEALQIIIPSIIYFSTKDLSIEDFSQIYKEIIIRSRTKDHVNMALNLFINESLNKADIIQDSFEMKTVFHEVSFNLNLFELPQRHDLFLKEYLTKNCEKCKTVPRSGAVCIICGTLVCVGQQCCRSSSHSFGECYTHRVSCSGSVGIFILIRSCALLIISDKIGTIVPAPYVNAYGEHDFDLSSSSALFLNSQLYYGKLTDMWRNGELRDFIARNMDNSRVTATSWPML